MNDTEVLEAVLKIIGAPKHYRDTDKILDVINMYAHLRAMQRQESNGWSNHKTYVVATELQRERYTEEGETEPDPFTEQAITILLGQIRPNGSDLLFTNIHPNRSEFGQWIKERVAEQYEGVERLTGCYRGLLEVAIEDVDWEQIAESYMDIAAGNMPEEDNEDDYETEDDYGSI